MKLLMVIILIAVIPSIAPGQTKMIINKTDGSADSLLLSEIKNITFKTTQVNNQIGIPTVTTLLTALEYPSSIWVKGDVIYLTETNGRYTSYGGKVCLDQYHISSHQKRLILSNPRCYASVVVSSTGVIYLTATAGSIPGNSGKVSTADTATMLETPLLDILIASKDMYIDENDDITIIGSSDDPSGKSLYLLPANDRLNPVVLKTGLGRTRCVSKCGTDIYFSTLDDIRCIDTSGAVTTYVNKVVSSISFSNYYLYYTELFSGKIGRIDLLTKQDETILTGLNAPSCVRYDAPSNRLYFLEAGSDANMYKDGTLKVAEW